MRGIVLLVLGMASSASIAAQAPSTEAIRAHVFIVESDDGFVDKELKWQREAVEDLGRLLAKDEPPRVIIVDDRSKADVVVEIKRPSFSRWSGKNLDATLTAGTYTKEFKATQGMTRGAAGSLHTQIRRWLKDNAATLIQHRRP
jgi:hypothetical protein